MNARPWLAALRAGGWGGPQGQDASQFCPCTEVNAQTGAWVRDVTPRVDAHVVFAGTRIASAKPSRTLFYYRTRLGSVIATSLAGGVRGAAYRYSPYGEVELAVNETDATRSELGYTNALRLTGSLLHLKNRVYDTAARVFIQPDVVDRLRYAYVAGDPVNASDPTGLLARYETLDGMQLPAAPDNASVADTFSWGAQHEGAGAWDLPASGPSDVESAAQTTQVALQEEQRKIDFESPRAIDGLALPQAQAPELAGRFVLRNRKLTDEIRETRQTMSDATDVLKDPNASVVSKVGAAAKYSIAFLGLIDPLGLPGPGIVKGPAVATKAINLPSWRKSRWTWLT